LSIGDKLRETREKQGLTLKDVQNRTKIRSRYLKALEEEDFELIPGDAYVRVFIKGYANQLGLDGNTLVKEYQQSRITPIEKEDYIHTKEIELPQEEEKESFLHKRLWSIIIITIILLLIGFVAYNVILLNGSQNDLEQLKEETVFQSIEPELEDIITDTPETIEEEIIENEPLIFEPTEELTEELEEITDEVIEEPITETPVEEEEKTLQIIVTARCWVRIRVDGETVYEGILEKGETKEFSGKEELYIRMGNAGGIKVKKGDEIIGPLGRSGEVLDQVIQF
jgi:cytoskeletal protein RodZ